LDCLKISVPSEGWREAFGIISAVLIGATAFTRMTLFAPQPTGPRFVEYLALPSLAGTSRDG